MTSIVEALPIRVLVVDDHTLFRRGIAEVLAKQESLEVGGRRQMAWKQ